MYKFYKFLSKISNLRFISIKKNFIKKKVNNNEQEQNKFNLNKVSRNSINYQLSINKKLNNRKLSDKQVISTSTTSKVQGLNFNMSGEVTEDDTNDSSSQTYSEYRKWKNTKLGNEMINNGSSNFVNSTQFTLVSYNILAQDLLTEHVYLYQQHDSEALNWDHRLQKIHEEIFVLKPDILCLQEVQENHLQEILDSFTGLNFTHIFKKKTYPDRSDGCAILFNKNLFSLISEHPVEYFQPNIYLLDRHNVGLIAKLSLKQNPNVVFLIATTHLLYNPRRQDVRLAQLQVLLAEIDRLSIMDYNKNQSKPRRMPIVLTGDFNLQPYSAPFNLVANGILHYENLTKSSLEEPTNSTLTNGKVFLSPALGITDSCQHIDLVNNEYEGESRLQNTALNLSLNNLSDDTLKKYPNKFSTGILRHNLLLHSTYTHPKKYQDGSTYQDEWITVDYIFYNKYFNKNYDTNCEGSLKLLSRYVLPNQNQCRQMGMIPNKNLGSDHLALAVKFLLVPNRKQNHL